MRLLETFLTVEQQRLSAMATLEVKKAELDAKRAEMEIEHAEELARTRREDREAAQKLRQQQREWAATSREKKRLKLAQTSQPNGTDGSCAVCAGSLNLVPSDVAWHVSGHTNRAMDLFH
jgi:septal ring factor EnvC (AmiA/AmiB activator)